MPAAAICPGPFALVDEAAGQFQPPNQLTCAGNAPASYRHGG